MRAYLIFSLFFLLSLLGKPLVISAQIKSEGTAVTTAEGQTSDTTTNSKTEPNCKTQFQSISSLFAAIEWESFEKKKPFSESAVTQAIDSLLAPLPEICETGAYVDFLKQIHEFARLALRDPNAQKAKLTAALALLKRVPNRVPFEEGAAAKSQLAFLKSGLDSVREDLQLYPNRSKKGRSADPILLSLQTRLFDKIATLLPPQIDPPKTSELSNDTVTIKLPTIPMPNWALGTILQVRDMLTKPKPSLAEISEAKNKLQFVIDWVNAPILNAPAPISLGDVSVVQTKSILFPNWAIETLYDIWLNALPQEITRRTITKQTAAVEKAPALLEAIGKLETLCKWIETNP